MKTLLSTLVLLASVTTFAATPAKKSKNYMTDKYMKMINLEGLAISNSNDEFILDGSEGLQKMGSQQLR